jgi:PAS domain-containing protein
VLNQQRQLELEIKLPDIGRQRAAPVAGDAPAGAADDLKAVILSISDITSRKLIELSLLERESFWSDVVRTVPDHLYVQDVISQRMIFSNHHLGQTLGYNRPNCSRWASTSGKSCCTPKTPSTTTPCASNSARSATPQLQCQLRFRHRDGGWRRFDIREQAWPATRRPGHAASSAWPRITEQIEASESLRDSEQRYRMLAESISDVIFSTDSLLALNYVSPSVQAVLGYEADWIFQNGWQSIIANPPS